MAKKRRSGKGRRPPDDLVETLEKVAELVENEEWVEARRALEPAVSRYPDSLDALAALATIVFELGDAREASRACERLFHEAPDDPEVALAAAKARAMNGRPALALEAYRRFLALERNDIRAPDLRRALPDIERDVCDRAVQLGLGTGEDAAELVAMHERVGALIDRGRARDAIEAARALMARRPDFVPAVNNLSLALMVEGRIREAVEAARSALALDPTNVHALANLVHYLILDGREEEAREVASRLAGAASPDLDAWVKKAEAYSHVGDDESVLAVYREAEKAGYFESDAANPLLPHFAAVAALRLGREGEARELWGRALDLVPGFSLAEENLEDLEDPVGERHAPWAFTINTHVRGDVVEDLAATVARVDSRGTSGSFDAAVRLVVGRHPQIERVAPVLLDRGDPTAREFALRIATTVRSPALLDALARFALGRRGPDAMRISAANVAIEAGLLPRGQTRMWIRGAWQEILLFACELHDDPDEPHSPKVMEWVARGKEALDDEDYERARRLYERAAAAEPHVPTARFNLAAVLAAEGRVDEALEMTEAIHREFPDYLFARAALAKARSREGRFDEAEALLAPMLERSRLHYSEFSTLCDAQLTLEHARKRKEVARSWLSIWEEAMPDHPAIGYWRDRLTSRSPLDRWTR